jgi:hypothetical protein
MGIKLGSKESFFACKLAQINGLFRPVASERVAVSTMGNRCKGLIGAAKLDVSKYATHSRKRGGTLEALKQGLNDAQI